LKVQTDRNNWNVPVPLDSDYAIGLLVAALVLVAAACYWSGVERKALSVNPVTSFCAVVGAASRRGDERFWIVWGLIWTAGVFIFTSIVIWIGLVAFA